MLLCRWSHALHDINLYFIYQIYNMQILALSASRIGLDNIPCHCDLFYLSDELLCQRDCLLQIYDR